MENMVVNGVSVIVQLGAPNDTDGTLSDIAIARCEKTLLLASQYPKAKILCTGGRNEHFNSSAFNHSDLTQHYIEKRGIDKARFLPSTLSRFTIEDASLSFSILEKLAIAKLLLVTSEFHMPRALTIFRHFYPNILISPQCASNAVAKDKLKLLENHEVVAIARDKKTLGIL